MAITKEIRNLEDLKARKEQLRKEVRLSRQALEQNLEGLIEKRPLGRALAGAAMSWMTAYTVRLFKRKRQEVLSFGAGSRQASLAGYLPILRKVIGFALDYLEQRFSRPARAAYSEPPVQRTGRPKEQPVD